MAKWERAGKGREWWRVARFQVMRQRVDGSLRSAKMMGNNGISIFVISGNQVPQLDSNKILNKCRDCY